MDVGPALGGAQRCSHDGAVAVAFWAGGGVGSCVPIGWGGPGDVSSTCAPAVEVGKGQVPPSWRASVAELLACECEVVLAELY